MKFYREQKKLILAILIVVSVTLTAILLYYLLLNKASISITVTPKDARVLVNNKDETVNASGISKFDLSPGNYTLDVVAEGYVPYSTKLTLKGGNRIEKLIDLQSLPKLTVLDSSAGLMQKFDASQVAYLGVNHTTLISTQAIRSTNGDVVSTGQKPMTPNVFSNVDKVIFSPDRQLALIKIGTDVYLYDFNKYDIIHQDMKKIGSDIGDIVWSPDQTHLAYYYAPKTGERSLIISDILNQSPDRRLNLNDLDNPSLEWSPDGNQLLIVGHGDQDSQNRIFTYDVYLKTLRNLTDGGILGAKYVSGGSKILYFVSNNDPKNPVKSEVWMMDNTGLNKKTTGIHAYPGSSYFQNDNQYIFTTIDDSGSHLVLADFKTQKISTIYFDQPKEFVLSNAQLSSDGKILYLDANGKLYATVLTTDQY